MPLKRYKAEMFLFVTNLLWHMRRALKQNSICVYASRIHIRVESMKAAFRLKIHLPVERKHRERCQVAKSVNFRIGEMRSYIEHDFPNIYSREDWWQGFLLFNDCAHYSFIRVLLGQTVLIFLFSNPSFSFSLAHCSFADPFPFPFQKYLNYSCIWVGYVVTNFPLRLRWICNLKCSNCQEH